MLTTGKVKVCFKGIEHEAKVDFASLVDFESDGIPVDKLVAQTHQAIVRKEFSKVPCAQLCLMVSRLLRNAGVVEATPEAVYCEFRAEDSKIDAMTLVECLNVVAAVAFPARPEGKKESPEQADNPSA